MPKRNESGTIPRRLSSSSARFVALDFATWISPKNIEVTPRSEGQPGQSESSEDTDKEGYKVGARVGS